MERAVIIAKGDVQSVGYRDAVKRIARKTGIVGYVENLKPYDVEIVAEGEKEQIEEFIKQIEIKKWPIGVTDLEITYGEPTGEFEYFEIRRGDWKEELGERLDTAGEYLYKSVALGEKSVELGEKSVELGEKMLEKQDQTVEAINLGFAKTEQNFNGLDTKYDKVSEKMDKIDKTLNRLVDVISSKKSI